jgi:hypothetical protein
LLKKAASRVAEAQAEKTKRKKAKNKTPKLKAKAGKAAGVQDSADGLKPELVKPKTSATEKGRPAADQATQKEAVS